jgi:microcin C transport system substrate-binding protein
MRRNQWLLAACAAVWCFTSSLQAKEQHGYAKHGDLKYPVEFSHFDSINPKAPKGGDLKHAIVGTFDTLNPFILKGTCSPGMRDIYFETLLKRSPDEPCSVYGLVAKSLEVAPNASWVIFNINPKAKWHDGTPITSKDVAFSYHTLLEHGTPAAKMYYKKVEKIDVLSPHKIKFTFKKIDGEYDTEMPTIIGIMGLVAEHDLKGKNFENTGMLPLLGSGPYLIDKVEPGRYLSYKRNPTYWAADLPVSRGYFNFDTIHFYFYKNAAVAFEAFKAGDVHIREESDMGKWANQYTFPAQQKGSVKCHAVPHTHQVGMQAFVFNTRQKIFKDPKVRRAFLYAFDYDWLNKNLFYGQLTRTQSFFDNTSLGSKDLPTGKELALLEPFRAQLPREVFEESYAVPSFTQGNRENLRMARKLLKEAGWIYKNGKLINEKTGEPFVFEIILNVPENEKTALALVRNLKDLGVQATARTLEAAQYENHRINMNFDMIMHMWGHSLSPGNEQAFYWSSKAADEPGTRNYPGIKDPVVDALCQAVATAKTREDLEAATRALDRVLLWGHYIIPLGHRTKDYVAYWNTIGHPPFNPAIGLPSIHTLWSTQPGK